MKLSIKTKVGMAVASIFTPWPWALWARGKAEVKPAGPIIMARPTIPEGRANAEENRTKFSDETETATTPKKAKKSKSLRSKKRHSEWVRENERTETNESGD